MLFLHHNSNDILELRTIRGIVALRYDAIYHDTVWECDGLLVTSVGSGGDKRFFDLNTWSQVAKHQR